ncbi:MAG: hypothetical protein IJ662_01105 [Clostridia bacterium]|nr:hypothetical protein [Clostridia bacterium]
MRKRLAWALCLAVLLGCSGARAEESYRFDDFFRSMVGRISFTLPGVPEVLREKDLTADAARARNGQIAWKNKIQLVLPMDEGECQMHMADLAPGLELIRQAYPGESEQQAQEHALLNFARVYISTFGGALDDSQIRRVTTRNGDGEAFTAVTFPYVFPDAPNAHYAGLGMMDGTQAVLIMGTLSKAFEHYALAIQPDTQAEADAFRSRHPQTVRLGRMRITFPVPPSEDSTAVTTFYDAFTPEYSYLGAEHMPRDNRRLLKAGQSEDDCLKTLLTYTAEQFLRRGELESYRVEKVQDGVWRSEGVTPLAGQWAEGTGPVRRLMRAYMTMDGLYSIHCDDTEEGRAFLDSIVFDAGEPAANDAA